MRMMKTKKDSPKLRDYRLCNFKSSAVNFRTKSGTSAKQKTESKRCVKDVWKWIHDENNLGNVWKLNLMNKHFETQFWWFSLINEVKVGGHHDEITGREDIRDGSGLETRCDITQMKSKVLPPRCHGANKPLCATSYDGEVLGAKMAVCVVNRARKRWCCVADLGLQEHLTHTRTENNSSSLKERLWSSDEVYISDTRHDLIISINQKALERFWPRV